MCVVIIVDPFTTYRSITIHIYALRDGEVVDADIFAGDLRNLTDSEAMKIRLAGFEIDYEVLTITRATVRALLFIFCHVLH